MAQSLARVIVHIIFSTKHRKPMISSEIRNEMEAYLGGTLREIGSPPIQVACAADHVHILCCLSRNLSLAKLVEEADFNPGRCPGLSYRRLSGGSGSHRAHFVRHVGGCAVGAHEAYGFVEALGSVVVDVRV